MILADKRDYKRGYTKHYNAYQILRKSNNCLKSRRLLLVYCVECGLKYKLLDKWKENNSRTIISNDKDVRKPILTSHSLSKIIKELGQAGTFRFPKAIETNHVDYVNDETFHQMCRYGITEKNEMNNCECAYEEELIKIAEWLKEVM